MFSPLPIVLEKVGHGGFPEEQWLHKVFAPHRSHGEWFAISPDIEAYMQTCDDPVAHEKPRVKIEPYSPLPFWSGLDISPENVSAKISEVGMSKASQITGISYEVIRAYRLMRKKGKDNIRGLIVKNIEQYLSR